MTSSRIRPLFVAQVIGLPALVTLGLCIRLFVTSGVTSADDLHLAFAALRFLEEGPYLPDGHVALRVGLTLPLAAIFRVFGVGEWQIALLPLIAGTGQILLAYAIASHFFGTVAGLWSAAAVSVFPLEALFSGRFYPDIIFGTVCGLAVYLTLLSVTRRRRAPLAIASGLVWGYAYLIKLEAFFLGFAFLGLFLSPRYRTSVVWATAACVAVVASENVIYYIISGSWFYRIKEVSQSYGISIRKIRPEARVGDMWNYPKSWFLTPYNFGIHYYYMFIGLILLLIRRPSGCWLVIFWTIAMMLWLQFGGNPVDPQGTKTKLDRYCSYITIPMAVSIGYFVSFFNEKSRWVGFALGSLLMLFGLFFSMFNTLSTERELASKLAIFHSLDNDHVPLYLDNRSYAIARYLTYNTEWKSLIHPMSDIMRNEEKLVRMKRHEIFIVVNTGFEALQIERYGVKSISLEIIKNCGRQVFLVNNPLPSISYQVLVIADWVGNKLPLVGEKISRTADSIWSKEDAMVFSVYSDQFECLVSMPHEFSSEAPK